MYTGLPLECHWLTQCTLQYYWATQRILAGYTGTPLEKLSWNSPTLECHWRNLVESNPHWDATGGTLTFAAYTGTPLERHWTAHTRPTHIVNMQSSIHASLKWQDGGTPVSKWTGLCIFSLYLEFTALQWMPVLLLTHESTSTLLCACIWYEHHYSVCVFGVASQMRSVEFKQLSPYQLYTLWVSCWEVTWPNDLQTRFCQYTDTIGQTTLDDHWSHKYTGMPLEPHWLMLAPSGVPVAIQC